MTQPLTILHTESSRGWGGQEFRILAESAALRARGHRVVIAAAPDGRILHRARQQGFTAHAVPFRASSDLLSVAQLRRIMRHERIDVLNTHSSIDSWVGSVAAKTLGAARPRVVRTRHLSIPLHDNLPTRWVYGSGCDAIVTTGEALRRTLMGRHGFDGRRIVSVPTGTDLERFDPASQDPTALRAELGLPAERILVGTVAMLRRMKGHHVLLDAVAQAMRDEPRLHLVLVGDIPGNSPVKDDLIAQAARLGLSDRLTMTGYREDIPRILAGLDIVCLPSTRDEGVPQGLMQAMAMRRPVIATDVGAVAELVIPDRTGLLAPPEDAPALAAHLLATIRDPAATARRVDAAREHVATRYSTAAMADAMERVFAAVVAGLPVAA